MTAILDACQALLLERDYDSITTARIAESAGIPIGSFYQYFPDKRSVVRALALRCTDKFLGEVERYFTEDGAPDDWRQAVAGVLAVHERMRKQDANFGRVRFAEVLDNHLEDPESDHRRMVADRLGALFATRYRLRKGAGYRLAFQAAVEAGGSLLHMADRVPGRQRRQVVATAQEVITTLLAKALEKS